MKHSLLVNFSVSTTKESLLSNLGQLKERLTGMRLQAKVKTKVRGYGD